MVCRSIQCGVKGMELDWHARISVAPSSATPIVAAHSNDIGLGSIQMSVGDQPGIDEDEVQRREIV